MKKKEKNAIEKRERINWNILREKAEKRLREE
jgi:hypothetical protein